MLRDVGQSSKAATVFLPHAPQSVASLQSAMRDGFMQVCSVNSSDHDSDVCRPHCQPPRSAGYVHTAQSTAARQAANGVPRCLRQCVAADPAAFGGVSLRSVVAEPRPSHFLCPSRGRRTLLVCLSGSSSCLLVTCLLPPPPSPPRAFACSPSYAHFRAPSQGHAGTTGLASAQTMNR